MRARFRAGMRARAGVRTRASSRADGGARHTVGGAHKVVGKDAAGTAQDVFSSPPSLIDHLGHLDPVPHRQRELVIVDGLVRERDHDWRDGQTREDQRDATSGQAHGQDAWRGHDECAWKARRGKREKEGRPSAAPRLNALSHLSSAALSLSKPALDPPSLPQRRSSISLVPIQAASLSTSYRSYGPSLMPPFPGPSSPPRRTLRTCVQRVPMNGGDVIFASQSAPRRDRRMSAKSRPFRVDQTRF